MIEEQIFKPFDEFKEGEFEQMFGNYEARFDTHSYTFISILQREGIYSYHIVENNHSGKKWFSINYRLFHEQNDHIDTFRGLDLLWQNKKGEYITFGTLKEAYKMLVKIIALEVLATEHEIEQYEDRYGMTIEEFREQQERDFAKMKNYAKHAKKRLCEPLELVKAQFIDLRNQYLKD